MDSFWGLNPGSPPNTPMVGSLNRNSILGLMIAIRFAPAEFDAQVVIVVRIKTTLKMTIRKTKKFTEDITNDNNLYSNQIRTHLAQQQDRT